MNRDFTSICEMITDFIRNSKETSYAFYGFFIDKFRKNINIYDVAPELASHLISAPAWVKEEFLETFDQKNELKLGICEQCGSFFTKGYEVKEQVYCSIDCVKDHFNEIVKDIERNPNAYLANL